MAERTELAELVSIPELARLWSVHPATVRRWIRAGELETVKVGRRLRVTRASAEAFVRPAE